MVSQCIDRELDLLNNPPKYMFVMRRKTAHILETKLMVQTNEAVAGRVLSYNDEPMSEEGRKRLRERVAVEHALARLSHLGIGQARYFGRVKTRFQLLMACTVANLRRVWNWTAARDASEALLMAA